METDFVHYVKNMVLEMNIIIYLNIIILWTRVKNY